MTTLNEVVQRVKAHPGIAGTDVVSLPDNDFAFAVGQVVHSALRELSEQDAVGDTTRPYTLTDPDDVTVTLDDAGTADLAPLTISEGVMLELLHLGRIVHPDWKFPLTFVRQPGMATLESNYQSLHARCWLEGSILHTRGEGEPLAGDLALAVAKVPGLKDLSVHRVTRLVDLVVARLRGVPVPKAQT